MYYNHRVAFHTLGCKLNYAETSAIGRTLQEHGYEIVAFDAVADYYVINTCSVTENADRECRLIVRQAQRMNPLSKVIIIGCYAQLKPEEISRIPGVHLVLGAAEKFLLFKHLDRLEEESQPVVIRGPIEDVQQFFPSFASGERTRAFLKVQDGCDYHCSFCTIPMARGASRSQSVSETVRKAREVATTGVKEIVLTGVNIGDFGKTPDGLSRTDETFYDLIMRLEDVEGVERFRISSIEPNLLTPEIIRFVSRSEKFVPHFHIPLQSGSDRILKFMRRKYLRALYRERIESIREVMPDAGIGVDVIVGFPGELPEHFQETVDFISSMPVSYLHVFTYSERDNTRAIQMEGAVPVVERKMRNKILRQLSEEKRRIFYEQMKGTTRKVLWEVSETDGLITGYTDNYVRVSAESNTREVNTISQELLGDFDESDSRLKAVQLETQAL